MHLFIRGKLFPRKNIVFVIVKESDLFRACYTQIHSHKHKYRLFFWILDNKFRAKLYGTKCAWYVIDDKTLESYPSRDSVEKHVEVVVFGKSVKNPYVRYGPVFDCA